MNIGWIFLGCALVVLTLMAILPWRRKQQTGTMKKQVLSDSEYVLTEPGEVGERTGRRAEIISLLQNGQKISAIKMYREDTGAPLREAKEAVERMDLAIQMDLARPKSDVSQPLSAATYSPQSEVESLLLAGQKIQAIKRYREVTGVGLREAKETVELIEETLLARNPTIVSLSENMPNRERVAPNEPEC
jgi:ribosomal protein L7/L12